MIDNWKNICNDKQVQQWKLWLKCKTNNGDVMGIERDTPPTTMTKWLRLGNRIGNEVPQSKTWLWCYGPVEYSGYIPCKSVNSNVFFVKSMNILSINGWKTPRFAMFAYHRVVLQQQWGFPCLVMWGFPWASLCGAFHAPMAGWFIENHMKNHMKTEVYDGTFY